MAITSALFQLSAALLAASCVSASPVQLQARGTVGNRDIVGFPETLPAGTLGAVYKAYQPYLDVVNGCVPFPGIGIDSRTNEGLKIGGGSEGGCSKSTGQVYARAAKYKNHYAILYSWYFPKDQPGPALGHRHDWEGVIVWLTDSTSKTAHNIAAVCPSSHGKWVCTTSNYMLEGAGVFVRYEAKWPINHDISLSSHKGGRQPLIAWESLPATAHRALNEADFGAANCPFNDGNFVNNIAKATF